MPKNRVIMIRVTNTQYERIVNNALAKGYKTISDYVRNSILGFDLLTETKIQKMFEVIVENKEKIREVIERSSQELAEV
ncbi:MAG: hypothetical protein ABIJ21_07540 [Nanoarchaeota archaeon]